MPDQVGTVVIIVSVLIFYLRLISIQRRLSRRVQPVVKQGKAGDSRQQAMQPPGGQLSILSRRREDWIIALVGAALIVFGVLLRSGGISLAALQQVWWLLVAVGILAFSFAFRA